MSDHWGNCWSVFQSNQSTIYIPASSVWRSMRGHGLLHQDLSQKSVCIVCAGKLRSGKNTVQDFPYFNSVSAVLVTVCRLPAQSVLFILCKRRRSLHMTSTTLSWPQGLCFSLALWSAGFLVVRSWRFSPQRELRKRVTMWYETAGNQAHGMALSALWILLNI